MSLCPFPLLFFHHSLSISLPLSPSAMPVFLGRWRLTMEVWSQWHCTFSPLPSLPCLRSILGRWLCVLSSLKALLSQGVELIDVPFPHLYVWLIKFMCAHFSFSAWLFNHLCVFAKGRLCTCSLLCECTLGLSFCIFICAACHLSLHASPDLGKPDMAASVPQWLEQVLCN